MARRCDTAPPLAAVALLFLLACAFHCAAAGRLLPATAPRAHQDQEKNGVKVAAAGATVLQQEGAMGSEDELSQSQMTGPEEADEACQDDECVQRRLLHDAHLDYIYTQHKGKP